MLLRPIPPKGSRKPHHFDPEFGFVKFYPKAILNQRWGNPLHRRVAASGRRSGCWNRMTHPSAAAVVPGAKNRIWSIRRIAVLSPSRKRARSARSPRWSGRSRARFRLEDPIQLYPAPYQGIQCCHQTTSIDMLIISY